jgi:hypothetical protein
MPARDPTVRAITSKIGAARRHHPDVDTSDLRLDLRVARAAEYVRGLRDLPLDRRAGLAAQLLTPAGDGA